MFVDYDNIDDSENFENNNFNNKHHDFYLLDLGEKFILTDKKYDENNLFIELYEFVNDNYDDITNLLSSNFDDILNNSVCDYIKDSNQNLSEQEGNSAYIAFLFFMFYYMSKNL